VKAGQNHRANASADGAENDEDEIQEQENG
jgi:hypothetical protein